MTEVDVFDWSSAEYREPHLVRGSASLIQAEVGNRSSRRFPAGGLKVGILCYGLLLCALSPSYVAAQVGGEIRGLVLDAVLETPLSGADLVLLDAGGEQVSRAQADEFGAFTFPGLVAGTYRLRVQRLGYSDTPSEEVELPAGARVSVILLIDPQAIELESIGVAARRRALTPGRELFAERQERGLGVFLTRLDILARNR